MWLFAFAESGAELAIWTTFPIHLFIQHSSVPHDWRLEYQKKKKKKIQIQPPKDNDEHNKPLLT